MYRIKNGHIPIDNQKILMRLLLSETEVKALIRKIPEIEELWVPNEKEREQVYRAALRILQEKEVLQIQYLLQCIE